MLTLLIEASTERGMIAILDKENILFHEELPFGYNNSKYLLPTIEKALHVTNLSVKQLSTIAVGIGPGSYTGIRIAAATAKALSYACKIPLVGICTLEGFVPNRDGSFATIIDAKISGTYLIKGR